VQHSTPLPYHDLPSFTRVVLAGRRDALRRFRSAFSPPGVSCLQELITSTIYPDTLDGQPDSRPRGKSQRFNRENQGGVQGYSRMLKEEPTEWLPGGGAMCGAVPGYGTGPGLQSWPKGWLRVSAFDAGDPIIAETAHQPKLQQVKINAGIVSCGRPRLPLVVCWLSSVCRPDFYDNLNSSRIPRTWAAM
jgi:hypothetical protein